MGETDQAKTAISNSQLKPNGSQNATKETDPKGQMTDAGLQTLLVNVNSSIEEDKARFDRGDLFNAFTAANFDENHHSNFIASLLDPKGKHGMGDIFLTTFIKTIDCLDNFHFNTESALVVREKRIKDDPKETGYIDIAIISGEDIIIIENKIKGAIDLNEQLAKYKEFGETFRSYRLLYLTIDGHKASAVSTKTMKQQMRVGEDYFLISCKKDIKAWLQKCEDATAEKPLLHSIIQRYKESIEQLTEPENSESIMHKHLLAAMTAEENIDSVTDIILNGEKLIKHVNQ